MDRAPVVRYGPTMRYSFEGRLNKPVTWKASQFASNSGRLKHVIFARQYDRATVDRICSLANGIREVSKTAMGRTALRRVLEDRRAMLYFTQPSTRTFLSFMAACQILGVTCNEIRDPSISSFAKGESDFDAVRMFSSYFDMVIMRSNEANLAESCAWLMTDLERNDQRAVPIVNGGSGSDEHPTQALLDIYTVKRTFEFSSSYDGKQWTRFDELRKQFPDLRRGPSGKTYCFCGDVGRGRTVRSLANLLTLYEDVKLIFVAPNHERLRLSPSLRRELVGRGVQVEEAGGLDEVIDQIDLLYMTRIQHEHDSDQDAAFFAETDMGQFKLTPERVSRMREHAAILHPFPRNDEIPFAIDEDPRAMYFRQARNGMWARAALIAYLFDAEQRIQALHRQMFSEYHDYNAG